MGTRPREDRRLRLLSAACLALPESERTDCGAHADFRVRGRIFAYFLKNHGGDGITAACFKSRLGEHVEYVKRAPERFYLPQYIGRRGWFGIRLDRQYVDWDEVIDLATISYHLVAAKGQRRASAAAPAQLANAVTAQALVRGAPPSVISVGLNARRMTEEQRDSERMLRSAAAPGPALLRGSAGLRGRR